jgi:hypothetical protein
MKLPDGAKVLVSSSSITNGMLPTDTAVWFSLPA